METGKYLLPEALRASYYEAGYWRTCDLWSSFDSLVAARPRATALIEGERSLTFEQLRGEAEQVGRSLRAIGFSPGEVVAVHGRHCLESAAVIIGCAQAGIVVALLPHMFSTDQIRAILELSGSRALFSFGDPPEVERARVAAASARHPTVVVSAVSAGQTSEEQEEVIAWDAFKERADSWHSPRSSGGGDDLALLAFSSGTTGEPKGVMHSANTIRFAVEAYAERQSISPSDRSLVATAFGFIGSSVLGTYLTYLLGCQTILQRDWNADEALKLVAKHRVTHTLLMPTHALDVLRCPALDATDCSSLTRGVIAGIDEARRLDTRRRFCARPYPMYGMSESPAHVTGGTKDDIDDLRTTEGRELSGAELRICDDDNKPVPAGQHGNILVRGPNRFLGYFRNDALNLASLTEDGFFRTGDIGFVDANGMLTFVSRSKDIIRRGGITITPADIEVALRPHPRVTDIAVIGMPDDRLGERACACVITNDGAPITLEELTTFLESAGFPRYLWPESVVICESFPRTPSLKVQKVALRRQVLDDRARQ